MGPCLNADKKKDSTTVPLLEIEFCSDFGFIEAALTTELSIQIWIFFRSKTTDFDETLQYRAPAPTGTTRKTNRARTRQVFLLEMQPGEDHKFPLLRDCGGTTSRS